MTHSTSICILCCYVELVVVTIFQVWRPHLVQWEQKTMTVIFSGCFVNTIQRMDEMHARSQWPRSLCSYGNNTWCKETRVLSKQSIKEGTKMAKNSGFFRPFSWKSQCCSHKWRDKHGQLVTGLLINNCDVSSNKRNS